MARPTSEGGSNRGRREDRPRERHYLVPSSDRKLATRLCWTLCSRPATCADFELTDRACKHMLAAKMWLEQQEAEPAQQAASRCPAGTFAAHQTQEPIRKTAELQRGAETTKGITSKSYWPTFAWLPGPVSQKGTKGGRKSVALRRCRVRGRLQGLARASRRAGAYPTCASPTRPSTSAKCCATTRPEGVGEPELTPILKD